MRQDPESTHGPRWGQPPTSVRAERFASLPSEFRRSRRTPWSEINAGGRALECFLEGPVFGPAGELLLCDIPNGRVFAIDPQGRWRLVVEYDGWPNGMKLDAAGVVHVTDHKLGLLTLDLERGTTTTLLDRYRSEGFKGLNDLFFADNGDLYFTDQGQTGLHDPSGRVFRLAPDGRLSCIADRLPSPNGLTMNLTQTQLFVAVTRANAIWRLPLMADGTVSKVGTYIQLSGGEAGPDGVALDGEGGLVVAHPGTTVWRFDRQGRATHVVDVEHESFFSNVAFGSGASRRQVFATDAIRGEVWRAEMPVAGRLPLSPSTA